MGVKGFLERCEPLWGVSQFFAAELAGLKGRWWTSPEPA